ncbi:WD40/YVTN/BNR-like repeat-containing protein [Pseudomonas schmalbachii]|nr:YCF48-related protein [Pseudomonas schmalbachii]
MNIEASPSSRIATQPGVARRALNGLTVVLPWTIIGGLLWAGLFIKPQPVGSSVTPPALERRDQFYGLAQAADGAVLAAGSYGKILSIGADGKIRRLPTPTDRTLQDIATWDSSHAVAVGNDGVILRSEDGGQHWSAVTDVPRSDVANKLNRVRLGKDGLAIATGEMGALLASHDYGKHWQRLREEEDVAWNDAALLDDGRLLVVGEFGRILLSDDLGQQWEEIPAPVPVSLMSVSFRDAANGVAVGVEGTVLVTSDGGRQWSPVQLETGDHLFNVLWNAGKKQWLAVGALGRWVTGTPTADGIDWQTGTVDPRDMGWHTGALASATQVWLAGDGIGRWDGQHWSPLKP